MSFAQGFQSGLNNMIQIYDMKSRRDARKKQEERNDIQWNRDQEAYEKQKRNEDFLAQSYIDEALGEFFNGNPNALKIPELHNSINRIFKKDIQQGYGNNKIVDGLHPSPDAQGLMTSVSYDDPKTGKRVTRKPVTVGRTNDPNDPVSIISVDDLINFKQQIMEQINSSDIPEAEKKKYRQRAKEAIHRYVGDNSLYEARIAKEKLQEERDYESKIAARNLANERETNRIKHGYALDLQRAKQKGEGGILSGNFNGVNYPVSKNYRLNATVDDINSSLNFLYKVSPENFANFTEENVNKLRFAKKLGSSWEQQYPNLLDVGTISDLAYQASINVIPDEKALKQKATKDWPDVTPEQADGRSKNEWINDEVERLKKEEVNKAEKMFFDTAKMIAQQRLSGQQQPIRGLGRQTPQPDTGGFQPLPPVETQPVGWMQDQQPAPQPEPVVQQPAQQQTQSTPELQAQASSFLDALEARRAQPQPEPTPEPVPAQPQVPQNVVPSGAQDGIRARLAMGEMMQQPPVKQLGRGQSMPPASVPQSFDSRGIGVRPKQPQQSDKVMQSFVQAVANGAPVEQITQNMVNLGVPEEQIAQVIQEGEQIKQTQAVQSVIQSVLQGGDIRIAQQALKQIGLDENTINKTINQALTLKKQQTTKAVNYFDSLENKRAQTQPAPTPEPQSAPQPQVPQNVAPSGVQDSIRAKLAMGEMMQQAPVKQLGRGQTMPPASVPQSFDPRGIGRRKTEQPTQSDKVMQSFVQAVANGAPVEQITQNMVNLGVPEEQIAQVIQEGEQVKQTNAVQSVIQSVLQGGDIRIAQQALKQIGLDENTINKTINQALTLKKQQTTKAANYFDAFENRRNQ